MSNTRGVYLAPIFALFACDLSPRVPDDVAHTAVLPPGSEVPHISDNTALLEQVQENDGFDGTVALLSGFSDGEPIQYWDLGPAPNFVAPVFFLGAPDESGTFTPNGHNPIIGVVPGDPGYTPFWSMWAVEVTDAYNGEIVPSVEALTEAQELGLVKPPQPVAVQINCPVADDAIRFEVGGAKEPAAPPLQFFYKGQTVSSFLIRAANGGIASPVEEDGVHVPTSLVYELQREGGVVLSEAVRKVDMTGDKDTADTNNIFKTSLEAEVYTPLVNVVTVTVSQEYNSIDTFSDQTQADFRSATDLFTEAGEPVTGNVVGYEVNEELRNMPIQFEAGAL